MARDALVDVHLLFRTPDEAPVYGAFLLGRSLVVALREWVHVFDDARDDEDAHWRSDEDVIAVRASSDRREGLCLTSSWAVHRVRLHQGGIESSLADRAAWDLAARRQRDAVLRAGTLVVETDAGERALDVRAGEDASITGWVGALLMLSGRRTYLVDVPGARRACLLDGFTGLVAATDDARTVVLARHGGCSWPTSTTPRSSGSRSPPPTLERGTRNVPACQALVPEVRRPSLQVRAGWCHAPDVHEVHFDDLDAGQRGSWTEVLRRTPLLADRRERDPMHWWLAVGIFAALVLATICSRPSEDPSAALAQRMAAAGILVAVGAALAQIGWRIRQRARAPIAVGRFLHRWGYAEVSLDRIRFVPGTALRFAVDVGRPALTGASRIVVRLSSDSGWSTAFHIIGSELDVPRDGLEGLATERLEVDAGYRDAARRVPHTKRRRWLPGPTVGTLVASGVAGLAASVIPVCIEWRSARADVAAVHAEDRPPIGVRTAYQHALLVAGTYPYFGWVQADMHHVRARASAEARARIEREVRAPYRDAMLARFDDGPAPTMTERTCAVDGPVLAPVAIFAWEHSGGAPVAELHGFYWPVSPSLSHYFEFHGADTFEYPTPRLTMRCTVVLEPIAMIPEPLRASFRADVSWEMTFDGRRVAQRAVTIAPEVIRDAGTCDRSRDGPIAEVRALAWMIRLIVDRDLREPGHGAWGASRDLDGTPEVLRCIERAAAALRVTDAADDSGLVGPSVPSSPALAR